MSIAHQDAYETPNRGNTRRPSDVLLVGRGIGMEKNHDENGTDRPCRRLTVGRSHDSHGSKWSGNWRISTSAVEPEFLWPLRIPASPLCLLSSLLRLLSCLPRRGWLLGLLPH